MTEKMSDYALLIETMDKVIATQEGQIIGLKNLVTHYEELVSILRQDILARENHHEQIMDILTKAGLLTRETVN